MNSSLRIPEVICEDDGPGLDGIDTAYIIGAAILGATSTAAAFGVFIHRAFIKPSRPRRTP